jgi:DNA recombination protein RmuC
VHIVFVIVLVAVIAIVSLLLAVARLKESGAAMSHATRELLLRLNALEEEVESAGRASQESMSSLRESLSASARAEREEIARSILSLGESQSKHMAEMASAQRDSMVLLSSQVSNMSLSSEAKLEAMREMIDSRLREMKRER